MVSQTGPRARRQNHNVAPAKKTSNLKLHITLLLGLTLCTVAFIIEIRRALSGNYLAWVYVIEWPVFAVFGTYVWWRLIHRTDDDSTTTPTSPTPAPEPPVADADDPELRAWQQYVRDLQEREQGRQDES